MGHSGRGPVGSSDSPIATIDTEMMCELQKTFVSVSEVTQGPWLKTESNTIYALHERSGLGGRVAKCNRMWLHVYFDRDVPEAEQQATVDAIAAVPEMLAAIKAKAVR